VKAAKLWETPPADRLVVVPPDKAEHRGQLYDLMAKCFPWEGYWRFLDYCRKRYFERSFYDWDTSRIGLIGRKVVTHYGVWDYQMRIGAARVRVAGIGGVGTDGLHRRKGYMAAAARAAIEAAGQAGYDVSILFGRDDLYHKFGYVRAWTSTRYFVEAAEMRRYLRAGRRPAMVRKFAPRARSDIDALYNRWHAPYVGTAVRPTYQLNPRPRNWTGYLWRGPSGRPGGYVLVHRKADALVCLEAAGPAEQALGVLAMLCERWHLREVRFETLPHDHPVTRLLRQGNCRTETKYVRSGSAMIRTISLASTLGKLCGELSRRLRASPLAKWRGELLIADKREKVKLTVGRGVIRARPVRAGEGYGKNTIRGGQEIAQLLIGTHGPEEITRAAGTRVTGRAKELLGVLFPERHPILGAWDHY